MQSKWLLLLPQVALFSVISLQLAPRVADCSNNTTIRCIDEEREALLSFKQSLVDEHGFLSSWGSEDNKSDCCEWIGVYCRNKTHHVYALDLQDGSLKLKGTILSPSLRKLQHLTYLDLSDNDFSGIPIADFIGSLSSKLRHLDLGWAGFAGSVPPQLGNLSNLQYLNLGYNDLLSVGNLLHWLYHLSSLRYLHLGHNNLSNSNDWPLVVYKLSSLTTLILEGCDLPPFFPSADDPLHLNSSKSLEFLDLSENNLTSSVYPWLFNVSSNLVELGLSSNLLQGSIPDAFEHMVSLQTLFLYSNELEGGIPKFFGNMCCLNELVLCSNQLTGQLFEFIQNLSCGCAKNSLESLDLSANAVTGPIPELGGLSSLKSLYLGGNRLNGTINQSLGRMYKLEKLSLGGNSLTGIPSSLSQLSGLSVMDLSYNNLSGKIPSGTQLQSFNASTYAGNELCGLPLPNKCPDEDLAPRPGKDDANTPEEEDQFITLGFYVSLILGFFVGFWGFCGTLLVKSSWRHRYYNFLTGIENWFYVTAVVNIAKLQRRLRS
ncbi:hypothetical protein KPL71_025371 [Citrus sinensis]|uniref:Uncharacterized protein n=1 Tax=Citrus sinensis TaxID=2711 RepID=A0ACB8HRT5_CITSI|nr:hypothetical protein KPL71_025371 [Citrus sinensis]